MRRRSIFQVGLGGIAALGVLPRIGTQKVRAADRHETFVYVSNAGTKDIHVLVLTRDNAIDMFSILDALLDEQEKRGFRSAPEARSDGDGR